MEVFPMLAFVFITVAETSILSVLTLTWPPLCPVRIYVSICSNGKAMCPHLFTWSQWNLKVVHKILYPWYKYQLLPGKLFLWQPFREGLAIFCKFENSPNGASILLSDLLHEGCGFIPVTEPGISWDQWVHEQIAMELWKMLLWWETHGVTYLNIFPSNWK